MSWYQDDNENWVPDWLESQDAARERAKGVVKDTADAVLPDALKDAAAAADGARGLVGEVPGMVQSVSTAVTAASVAAVAAVGLAAWYLFGAR